MVGKGIVFEFNSLKAFFTQLPEQMTKKTTEYSSNLSLHCVLLLKSVDGIWPEKDFEAIRETWGKDCNESE